jgi:hypothetical protein
MGRLQRVGEEKRRGGGGQREKENEERWDGHPNPGVRLLNSWTWPVRGPGFHPVPTHSTLSSATRRASSAVCRRRAAINLPPVELHRLLPTTSSSVGAEELWAGAFRPWGGQGRPNLCADLHMFIPAFLRRTLVSRLFAGQRPCACSGSWGAGGLRPRGGTCILGL